MRVKVSAKGARKTSQQLGGVNSQIKNLAKSAGLAAAAFMGARGLFNAFKSTIQVGKTFEQSLANLRAISGATGSAFKALEEDAKRLGASTKFTASNVAELQTEFAKLGFLPSQIVKVTEATLNLAAATGEQLADSAVVAGGTLRGFGMEADETARVTDVMAASFSSSALDLEKFRESMKFVAPVAKTVGFNIEETTAILGKLADSSIHGSLAGTSLKNTLMQMSLPGSKLSDVFGKTVNGFDEFVEVLVETKEKGGLTDEQLGKIPLRLQATIPVLIEAADQLMGMKDSLDQAAGSAKRMADIQMDTLEGRMLTLKSATECFQISLFDTFDEPLKYITENLTGFVNKLNEWVEIPSTEKLHKERTEFNALIGLLKDASTEQSTRNTAIAELQVNYADYIGNIDLESASVNQLKDIQKKSNDEFERQITLKAKEKILAEKRAALINAQTEVMSAQLAMQEKSDTSFLFGVEVKTEALNDLVLGMAGHTDVIQANADIEQRQADRLENARENLARLKEEYDKTSGALTDMGFVVDEVTGKIIKHGNEASAGWKKGKEGIDGAGDATKELTKLTKEHAIASGLASQSALGAIRTVIKAKFAEMMAKIISKEIGEKGFLGILTGAALAGLASQLFEEWVPKFAKGGDFVTAGPQMIMVGDNPSGVERVQITPSEKGSGGGSVIINISAPLVDDTVIDHIVPAIEKAVSRGQSNLITA